MVQMRTEPAAAGDSPRLWPALLAACLAPLAVFALLALALGEARVPLGIAAAALLVTTFGWLAVWGARVAAEERRETGRQLAAQAATEAAATRELLAELGLPEAPPLAPGGWDVDLQRRPRRLVAAAGALDEGRLGELVRRDASRLTRAVAWIAAAALALLAFVGFGGAARVGRDLVAHRAAYVYTVPALVAMLLLVFLPFLYGLVLSFTNANIYNSDKPLAELWVGLANFGDILTDWRVFERTPEGLVFDYHNFYWTLGFTAVWTVSNVLLGVTLGLALALALNTRGLRLRPLYRVLLILPWAMPNYISALIFRGMFHQQFGVVNQLRQLFGAAPLAWFDSPLTSFLALLTTNGWLSFPFMMVVSLGALQSIPADLYEAARVDGATRWQQFRAITLPSLRPALVPAVILSVIWTFNQFNVVYLVSAGEPAGATEILITQAFKIAFEQYRYGYAAAYSMLIFLILLAYGTWQNRVTKATEAIA
jgi:arabinogalactan oligomer/maltooligosaccharide transport system permease protein